MTLDERNEVRRQQCTMNSFGRPTALSTTGPVPLRYNPLAARPQQLNSRWQMGRRIAGGGRKSSGGGEDDIYFPNQSDSANTPNRLLLLFFPRFRFARRHGYFINDSPSVGAQTFLPSTNYRFKGPLLVMQRATAQPIFPHFPSQISFHRLLHTSCITSRKFLHYFSIMDGRSV